MSGECGEFSKKKSKTSSCPESKKPAYPETNEKSQTGKGEFGRQICVAEEKSEAECHESRKRFFGDSEYKKEKGRNMESKCGESTEKRSSKGSCCSSNQKEKGSSECGPRKSENCSHREVKNCGPVNYFAPQCFTLSAKSELPSCVTKGTLKMPEPTIMVMKPRRPKVEKGELKPCIKRTSKVECINACAKKPSLFSEFFCIDARNVKMNECIKQYMKDPSKMNVQCAQFARKRMHTVTQAPCPESSGFLPPKYRQVAKRWLPAVGVYMVATAALACWVTEWGEVVNRIPFYKDKEPLPDRPVPSDGDDRD